MNRKSKNVLLLPSILFLGLTFATTNTFANNEVIKEEKVANKKSESEAKTTSPLDIPKVSEAFGHLIGKNLESLGFEFDMNKVIKGIQDSVAGLESPMSESECVQAISQDQEKKFKQLSEENLSKAESFLKENAKQEEVVALEDNKLQYKVEKSGNGETVQEHFSPLIRYSGKFLDGKVFGESKEDEMISLDETIPGFSKGIVGMKEGEKRTLFIHPELGYGTSGYLPPNSLLTFEIEVIKANSTPEQDSLSSTTAPIDSEDDSEIASDDEPSEPANYN